MTFLYITAYFGGNWVVEDGEWNFVGNISSKPLIVDEGISFDDLKTLIVSRFKICMSTFEVELSYKNPFNCSLKPFDVNTLEDFEAFVEINKMEKFSWSIPLCIKTVEVGYCLGNEIVEEPIKEVLALVSQTMDVEPQTEDWVTEDLVTEDQVTEDWVTEDRVTEDWVTEDWEIMKGKTYKNKTEVKNSLCLNAIVECSQYRIVKSRKRSVTARCIDKECKWRVCFTMQGKSSTFVTTVFEKTHTCSMHLRRKNKRNPSFYVIAKKVKAM